jgi:hypothetical protein
MSSMNPKTNVYPWPRIGPYPVQRGDETILKAPIAHDLEAMVVLRGNLDNFSVQALDNLMHYLRLTRQGMVEMDAARHHAKEDGNDDSA